MRFHDVYLFYDDIKLDDFAAFVASGAGLFVIVVMLRRALLSVLLLEFTLF